MGDFSCYTPVGYMSGFDTFESAFQFGIESGCNPDQIRVELEMENPPQSEEEYWNARNEFLESQTDPDY